MSAIKLCLEKIRVQCVAFEITERAEYREFQMTQNDTLPYVEVQFLDDINDALDITGWTVNFFFRKPDSRTLINVGHTGCDLFDPTNGLARYKWQGGDLANVGLHYGSFQITTDTDDKQSIRHTLRFNVRPELDLSQGSVSGHSYVNP